MANNKPKKDNNQAQNAQRNKDQSIQTTTKVKSSEKAMIDKVNDKLTPREDSLLARFIGTGLIILGVLFVILAIIVVVFSTREASLDRDLSVPTIEAPRLTNDDQIRVSGKTEDNGTVMFWVNGNEYSETASADNDGKYEIQIKAENEGEYRLQAAYVRGFPLRQRSERSKEVVVVVDRTAPSSEVKLDYEKVVSGSQFTIKGNVEPDVTVIVELDGEEYTAKADDNGDFVIEGIVLKEGSNSLAVSLEDEAGNRVDLDDELVVEYVPGGDIDGDGIRDIGVDLDGDGIPDADTGTELPEASGELEAAMDFLFGNKLMLTFGLFALALFAINTGAVVVKLRND